MRRTFLLMTAFTIISVIFLSCGGNGDNGNNGTKDSVVTQFINVPPFNEDSALNYVKNQCDFGPRVPGTPAHSKCAQYLEDKFRSFIPDVIVQEADMRAYNGRILNGKNIIVSYKKELPGRILLCSHWDSRPYADHDQDTTKRRTPIDGANDGASGVGILLEIARLLSIHQPEVGVDIILFDIEDYGEPQNDKTEYPENNWGLGSQYWARNPHIQGYRAKFGILLDMVGVPNATFRYEGVSMQYAPDIVSRVWKIASQLGYGNMFLNEQGGSVTDDHYFINKFINIPTIDIIHNDKSTQSGFYTYWHTTKDTFDNIDKKTLKAVGQVVLTIVYEEAKPAS